MDCSEKTKWSFESEYEMVRDLFFIKLFLETIKRMTNVEAQHYLSMYIKPYATIIIHEISRSAEQIGVKGNNDWYNSDFKKFISDERQKSSKRIITASKAAQTLENMGICFDEKIYDINIVLHENQLLALNFDEYHDNVRNHPFWDELFNLTTTFLNAFFQAHKSSLRCDSLFTDLAPVIDNLAKAADTMLSGTRYSYSAFKLFSKSHDLVYDDKVLILYKYRMIYSSLIVEKMFSCNQFPTRNPMFDSLEFFRKCKAITICAFYEEIKKITSPFRQKLQSDIDRIVEDPRFFVLNRRIRNNIHYTSINCPSKEQIGVIDTYQNKCLQTVFDAFTQCLYVDIDAECLTMTTYLSELKT